MIHFDKDFLEIHWDEDVKCVLMIWKKFVKGVDFKNGLNSGLDLITEKKSYKWLADLRDMQVLSLEDQDWSNYDWYPRAVKGGIRKMAIIQPASAVAKMSVKNILSKVGNIEIETTYFDNLNDAKNWLRNA